MSESKDIMLKYSPGKIHLYQQYFSKSSWYDMNLFEKLIYSSKRI